MSEACLGVKPGTINFSGRSAADNRAPRLGAEEATMNQHNHRYRLAQARRSTERLLRDVNRLAVRQALAGAPTETPGHTARDARARDSLKAAARARLAAAAGG